jgi:glycosyltransferase involved in cell wall biosynthesis
VKVAFVHDWLVTYRGGEKVLEALIGLYPEAPIYTLFYRKEAMPQSIQSRLVVTPPGLGIFRKARKLALPFFPSIIESFDFSDFDLVISTSSCVAKGIIGGKKTKHICYLHSPMRYIWDQQEEYIRGVSHIPGAGWAIRSMSPRLRKWDVESAQRVDRFVVNSTFVGERCQEFYNRGSVVVHPPIETNRFKPSKKDHTDQPYYLAAGAFVSYKRFDLAIAACEKLGRKLIIAGSGPAESQLRKIAGPHTFFESSPSDSRFVELMAGAQALLFPGVEDFGMVAVEAMAAGTPVSAFAKGGARDFIVERETGLFFETSGADSLAGAMLAFEKMTFSVDKLTSYAAKYGREHFVEKMKREINLLLQGKRT